MATTAYPLIEPIRRGRIGGRGPAPLARGYSGGSTVRHSLSPMGASRLYSNAGARVPTTSAELDTRNAAQDAASADYAKKLAWKNNGGDKASYEAHQAKLAESATPTAPAQTSPAPVAPRALLPAAGGVPALQPRAKPLSAYGTGSVTFRDPNEVGPRKPSMIGGMRSDEFFKKTAQDQKQSNSFASYSPPSKANSPSIASAAKPSPAARPQTTATAPVSKQPLPGMPNIPTATTPTVAATSAPKNEPFKPDIAGMRRDLQAGNEAINKRIATPLAPRAQNMGIQQPRTIASVAGGMAENLKTDLSSIGSDVAKGGVVAGKTVLGAAGKVASAMGKVAIAPAKFAVNVAEKAGEVINAPLSPVSIPPVVAPVTPNPAMPSSSLSAAGLANMKPTTYSGPNGENPMMGGNPVSRPGMLTPRKRPLMANN